MYQRGGLDGGRLGSEGEEIEALQEDELAAIRGRVYHAEALAVVLLHSYANNDHEERVAECLQELGLPLSVSSRLLPEYREYERTSTTAVNAYVSPIMSRYLGRLDAESGAETVHIMASNGGAVPVERAIRVLGLPSSCSRRLPSGPEFTLEPETLDRAVRDDLERALTA